MSRVTDIKALIQAAQDGNLELLASILQRDPALALQRDDSGATALHYAALNGHRKAAELLVKHGADVNSRDAQFGATPTGWAIEYLRTLGGFLAIEIDDLAYATSIGDSRWVARLLTRFPELRTTHDANGKPLQQLARERGHAEIIEMFADKKVASGPLRS